MKPNEVLRIPEVGEYVRTLGRLVKVEEIPQPTLVDYIFEEVSATVRSLAGGRPLNEHGSFNEYYGEGTAVEAAIKEARRLHSHYGRSLTFIVERRTEQTRKRLPEYPSECIRAKGIANFVSTDWASQRDLPDPVVEIVWSSDNENQDASPPVA